jgi:hypothetical protein
MNPRHIARVAGAALLSLTFAACGSGGATSSAVPAPNVSAHVTSGATTTSLVIHVPNQSATAANTTRQPQYISASTQSIGVAIAPQAGCTGCSQAQTQSANLTPASPNCATSPSGLACTIALNLNPGTYTIGVTTYTGPLAAGAPTGAVLSTDSGLPMTVTGGQANTIGVALNGIPAGLKFTINTPDPTRAVVGSTLFAGPSGAIFAMTASAVDAGGNLITGMGTTTISAVHTPGSPAAGITASAIPSSNLFGVTTPPTGNLNVDVANVTMHGGNCALTGAVCTSALNLRFTQNIAVIDSAGVDIFTPWGAHIATVSNGVSQPSGVGFDQSGNLVVANKGTNTATVYSAPYVAPPFATVTGILNPTQMVASRSAGIFIGSATNIFEIQSPYAAITATLTGFGGIGGLATDLSNDLFVSDAVANKTFMFRPPYVPQAGQQAYSTSLPSSLVSVTSQGTTFVGNGSGTVAELNGIGAILSGTVQSSGTNETQLLVDSNNNLAILDAQAHGFDYAAAPAFTPTFVPMPATAVGSFGVFDVFGNLYVEGGGTSIYTFLAPSMQAGPVLTVPNGTTAQMAIWTPDP